MKSKNEDFKKMDIDFYSPSSYSKLKLQANSACIY
jgi:hypothetical protein